MLNLPARIRIRENGDYTYWLFPVPAAKTGDARALLFLPLIYYGEDVKKEDETFSLFNLTGPLFTYLKDDGERVYNYEKDEQGVRGHVFFIPF